MSAFRDTQGLTKAELSRRQDELIDDRKAVVKVINKIRKARGEGSTSRVTKGIPCHNQACPVAMSLRGTGVIRVGVRYFVVQEPEEGLAKIPFAKWLDADEEVTLARFIRHIDQGLYPELEIPKSVVKVKGEVVE